MTIVLDFLVSIGYRGRDSCSHDSDSFYMEIVILILQTSVLETPGIPVTGTPSIYLVFYSIYNRQGVRRQAIYL